MRSCRRGWPLCPAAPARTCGSRAHRSCVAVHTPLFTPLISAQQEEYHKMFFEYYGDHDWADRWVTAALDSTPTNFNQGGGQAAGVDGGGNADFSAVRRSSAAAQ